MKRLMHQLAKSLPALVVGVHLFLLIVALYNHSYFSDDSFQYLRLSRNMWQHGIFSQADGPPIVYDLQRTPGYPFFLMILGNWIPLILVVQHLLVFATAYFSSVEARVFDVSGGSPPRS